MAALNIPIQMFGACSTLGDMTPLWFRYENKEHGIITVKIESIVSSREVLRHGAYQLCVLGRGRGPETSY